jgi:type VI secretion system secreted protein VgrG
MGKEQFLIVGAGPEDNGWNLSVRRFTVCEELSTPFSVRLVVNTKQREIDLETMVGQPAFFQLNHGKVNHATTIRRWEGICEHAEVIHVERPNTEGESTYFLHIVPTLWLLTQRVRSRIFQHKKLSEIVLQVLGDWGVEHTTNLDDKLYRQHEYVVQYMETDFAFVSRLMEWAGITYYWKYTPVAPGALTAPPVKLELTDQVEKNPLRAPPVHYVDNPSQAGEHEFLSRVQVVSRVRPGKFTVFDHDFRRKVTDTIYAEANVNPSPGKQRPKEDFYEQYHYVPGDFRVIGQGSGGLSDKPSAYRYDEKNEGADLAKRGLAASRRRSRSVRFVTDLVELGPGAVFSITNHPNDAVAGKPLLVERYSAEGFVNEGWTFEGEALFAGDVCAPEPKTPKPRIRGVQSAIVTGPADDEIYADEFGRVKVQFHWDPDGKYDENSSCWMRVNHEWAALGFGTMLLPRIGQEVLVGFLEGDPDLPVIVGRAYNGITQVPYPLPKNATRSTWKSNSSGKGVPKATPGFNEIMFEDLKEKELVYMQAELDLQKLVKKFETDRVGENHMTIVGTNRSAVVHELDATMVGKRHLIRVIDPVDKDSLKIIPQQDPNPAVSPHATVVEMKEKRVIFTTGEASLVLDGPDVRLEASGKIVVIASGGDTILEGKHVYLNSKTPPSAPKPESFTLPTPALKRQ